MLGYGVNEVPSSTDYLDSKAQERYEETQVLLRQSAFYTNEVFQDLRSEFNQIRNSINSSQQTRQSVDNVDGFLRVRRLPKSTAAFTGRIRELSRLSERLYGDIQVINGLGGVGKTQLAVQYALLQQGSYDVIWRVRSSSS